MPVLQIIEHLEADAHMPGIAFDRPSIPRENARQPDPNRQRDLERRRGLEGVDRQRLRYRERRVTPDAPPQLGPLPAGQAHMGIGEHRHEVGAGCCVDRRERGDDPVAETHEVVTGIQGDRDPNFFVEGRPAVAHAVGILDVVVDQ